MTPREHEYTSDKEVAAFWTSLKTRLPCGKSLHVAPNSLQALFASHVPHHVGTVSLATPSVSETKSLEEITLMLPKKKKLHRRVLEGSSFDHGNARDIRWT